MTNDTKPSLKVPPWKRHLNWLFLKAEGLFTRWRKRLQVDPEISFFVSEPIKQAAVFAAKLYPDDKFYLQARYAWVGPEDARKLFLYGCARQVLKAAPLLLENEDNIQGLPQPADVDALGRQIIEAIIDAQHVVLRRHLEQLANLIGFSQLNKGEAFRLFLNAENLDHFLGLQADFGEFFESRSLNRDASIVNFAERVEKDLKQLSGAPWFLRANWKSLVRRAAPSVFTSVRSRIMAAIPHATADEKLVIGMSYDFFSRFSVSAHAAAGARIDDRHYRPTAIRGNIKMISLLGFHIVSRMNRLMAFEDPNDFANRMEGKSVSPELIKQWSKEFEVGDLVFAMGDLAEVIGFKKSKYGYTSVTVKFLTRPPLQETPTDSLPAAFVGMVMPKKIVRSFLMSAKDKPDAPTQLVEALGMMEKESDETLRELVMKSLVEIHKHGVLIPWLLERGVLVRQPDEDDE